MKAQRAYDAAVALQNASAPAVRVPEPPATVLEPQSLYSESPPPTQAQAVDALAEALAQKQAQEARLTLLPDINLALKKPKEPLTGVHLRP